MTRGAQSPNRIPEYDGLTEVRFRDIAETARPAVFRGLVSEWPVVQAAAESVPALAAYLGRFDHGNPVPATVAPAAAGGRLFYNDDLSGFNFRRVSLKLADAFQFFRQAEAQETTDTLVIQSVRVQDIVPGFETDNPLDVFGRTVEPRLWMGNAAIVAAHFDAADNVACAVAGRRRFTLFAPDQIANLYPGPIELTPAGTMISLVDFDHPDYQRFPRFADAMARAWIADLEPGDAIYIPYLWWHHVRSTAPFNMLVNYWPKQSHPVVPMAALTAGILAMKNLSATQRAAWDEVFGHYLFERRGPIADHIPIGGRGLLGRLTLPLLERGLARLNRQLSPDRIRRKASPEPKE